MSKQIESSSETQKSKRKHGRTVGASSYSHIDDGVILSQISYHLPVCSNDWNKVMHGFNSNTTITKKRTLDSIKGRFINKMVQAKKTTGNPVMAAHIQLAKDLAIKINEKGGGDIIQGVEKEKEKTASNNENDSDDDSDADADEDDDPEVINSHGSRKSARAQKPLRNPDATNSEYIDDYISEQHSFTSDSLPLPSGVVFSSSVSPSSSSSFSSLSSSSSSSSLSSSHSSSLMHPTMFVPLPFTASSVNELPTITSSSSSSTPSSSSLTRNTSSPSPSSISTPPARAKNGFMSMDTGAGHAKNKMIKQEEKLTYTLENSSNAMMMVQMMMINAEKDRREERERREEERQRREERDRREERERREEERARRDEERERREEERARTDTRIGKLEENMTQMMAMLQQTVKNLTNNAKEQR